MNFMEMVLVLLVRLLVLCTSIPVHEYAHAWAADRLGDPNPRYQGRLTLNPKEHIDPFGAIFLILTGFGWGKSVSVNAGNFKNPKRGMILTSLAGPVSNLVMAFCSMIVYKIIAYTIGISPVSDVFYIVTTLNIGLAVFNLVPIPPLDGAKILTGILPSKLYFKFMEYERYIFLILLLAMWTGILSVPLSFVENLVYNAFNFLTGFIDYIFR